LGSVRRRLCSHGAHTGCPLKAIEQAQIRCALFLFHKSHAAVRIEIDPYQISEPYLSGRYQVCEREHNVFLNGAFQMPGSVFRIRTVFQKKVFHALHAMKSELPDPGRRQDALLHHAEFDFENLLEMFWPQGFEDNELVYTVHELRRKLASRCFHGGAIDLLVKADLQSIWLSSETHRAFD